jgi:hypothetical protein
VCIDHCMHTYCLNSSSMHLLHALAVRLALHLCLCKDSVSCCAAHALFPCTVDHAAACCHVTAPVGVRLSAYMMVSNQVPETDIEPVTDLPSLAGMASPNGETQVCIDICSTF